MAQVPVETPAGAQAKVDAHKVAADPHPGLTGGGGTAAVSAHEAAGDPHPGYLAQAEGDVRYPLLTDPRLVDAREPDPHAGTHASGGTDLVTPGGIGAATPADVAGAVSAHSAAGDPHAGYATDANLTLGLDAVGTLLRTNWTRRSNGPMGGAGDEGTPFVIPTTGTTVVPTVSGGKLVCDMTSSPGAVYVNQQLPGKLKRIGAVFGIGPGAAGSAAALIAWTDINMAGGVPDTHCHLTIGPTSWGFDIWQGQVSSSLIFEALPVALAQDYRPYRAEVSFDNDTATISLPNGLVRKVVDPRIASINGAAASWEFYQPAATAPLAFYQTWADTFPTVPGSVNEQRSAEIAGANAPPSVTASVFGKVDYQLYPFPTSSGIIDAAVVVTGSRGPTGGVLVDVEAPVIMTNATSYVWEIHIDGGYGVGIVVLAQPFTGFLKKRFVLTGLSAGNHSFLLRHWQVDALANNSIEVWNAQGKKILMSATPI